MPEPVQGHGAACSSHVARTRPGDCPSALGISFVFFLFSPCLVTSVHSFKSIFHCMPLTAVTSGVGSVNAEEGRLHCLGSERPPVHSVPVLTIAIDSGCEMQFS